MPEQGHFRGAPRPRAECRVEVAFPERGAAPVVAYTSDVGVGGLCLAYGEPLRVGERVEVTLSIPSRWAPLALRAEVAWQRPGEGGEPGQTGFAFVGATEEEAAALKDLVATLVFED